MDYDKVVVMKKGKAVEFGEPFLLIVKNPSDNGITNKEGELAKMIMETGEESSRALFITAQKAYLDR